MSNIRTSISYPKEYEEPLKALAKKDGRSFSGYLQIVLRDHLISKGINPDDEKKSQKKSRRPRKKK